LQNRFTGVDIVTDVHVAEFTAPTLLACAVLCALLWRRWLLLSQARAAAQLAGLSPARWDSAFLSLLALVVLLGTNALGVVLVLAMLFLPAATVLPWTRRIPGALAAAAALALIVYVSGFVVSNEMNWPLSQSVGGLGAAVFLVSYLASRVFR
jgi:ABC-type Mn2+/Zn2+ transport system permease subunit